MDNHNADECLIKTHNNEHEQETARNTEILVLNELLLLREDDLKLELCTETVLDDPLNILNKMEIKMEKPEISVEFIGEHNESEFLNALDATSQAVTPDTDYPSSSSSCRKRRRCTEGELEEIKSCDISCTETKEFDKALLSTTIVANIKEPARLVANILDAWHLLVDETILANVLKHTNDEIKRHKSKALGNNNRRILDLAELSAWIGMNYLCGIFSKSGATLEELWTPELGNGIFRASMSLKRFEFINECLRLGESKTKAKTKRKCDFVATLKSVTEVWEKFIENCRSCYQPGVNCTVHEHVLDMSATDFHKQLGIGLTTESTHCSVRIIGLHDSKTNYLFNALLGKSAPTDKAEILTLVRDIKKSKRNLILSERYTSLELAEHLVEYQFALVGSISPKSKDFAKSRQAKHKNKSGAVFSFLSESSDSDVLLTSGISDKINPKKLYEASVKSGEQFYQSTACFSTATIFNTSYTTISQRPWTLRFFHAILDYACINAWMLFRLSQQGDAAVQQRDFQRQLGICLTQKYLKRLLYKNHKIPLQRKLLICDILGESPENVLIEAASAAAHAITTDNSSWKDSKLPNHVQLLCKKTEKRRRCRVCTWRSNNLTGWQCQQCARAMCPTHLINRCEQCLGIEMKHSREDEEQDEYFK